MFIFSFNKKYLYTSFKYAFYEFKSKFKRTYFGSFWTLIATSISILAISTIWAVLFKINLKDFIIYLSIGLIFWYFISKCLSDSANSFVNYRYLLINVNYPPSYVSLITFFRNFFQLLQNFIFLLFILILFINNPSFKIILFAPNLFIILFSIYFLMNIFGYLGARFRDFPQLINAILHPIFLITPILYEKDNLGDFLWIAEINIVSCWIDLVRYPFLDNQINLNSYFYSLFFLIFLFFINLFIEKKFSRKLGLWVN